MRVYRIYMGQIWDKYGTNMGQIWDRLGQIWDRFPNPIQIYYIYYARYVCAYTRKEILINLKTIIKQGEIGKKITKFLYFYKYVPGRNIIYCILLKNNLVDKNRYCNFAAQTRLIIVWLWVLRFFHHTFVWNK